MDKLLQEITYLYNELGMNISNFTKDKESEEYGACCFKVNNLNVIARKSKITPNKIGSFVTFWKRENKGPIMPYSILDNFDLLVVNATLNENKGQFVFSKEALHKNNIISNNNIEGKRAFRLYCPWDIPNSKQAISSQKWQLKYFIDMSLGKEEIINKIGELYKK